MPVPGSMLFIPTAITGSPSIGGQPLKLGSFVQLNTAVTVQPQVTCLVVRAD